MSFCQRKCVEEINGITLIATLLFRLQIIHGRTIFKLHNSEKEFSMLVTSSNMHTLEFPGLRDILNGSVSIENNENLCHVRSINWNEIMTGI